jgi:gamma-glutamyl-gamma-aminobutyrate hydrolase PuuD
MGIPRAARNTCREKAPIGHLSRPASVERRNRRYVDIRDHDMAETTNIQKLRYDAAAIHRFSAVNSSHHQAIDTLGHGIVVEGWSSTDDIIEQTRLRDYPFAIGVQYHPERHSQYRSLFDDFYEVR